MGYTEDHVSALADVTEAGSAVTFTHSIAGTYDPSTRAWSGASSSTVAGYAVQVKGKPETYQALGLVESKNPTLLFVPTTYGEVPAVGWTVTWSSTSFTVRDVDPLAPDGTVISAKVVVGV